MAEQRASAILYQSVVRGSDYRTAYGATMPKAAKLTMKGNSQVLALHLTLLHCYNGTGTIRNGAVM